MYEYVEPTEWKTLNALEGFGTNSIPATDKLAGTTLEVRDEDGAVLAYEFHDGEHLTWPRGKESYVAREVLEDVFLVDFMIAAAPAEAIALVVDLPRSLVTTVHSTVGDEEIAVSETVSHGTLPGARPGDRHQRTEAMVGKRVQYIYDADHAYEHIYLNGSTYAWQCLAGAEKGQADADPTQAFEIRPEVYLFCWRERVVPCDAVVVIDWVNMRNNGRIFGYDTAADEYNSIRMGARAVPLNTTEYVELD
jgi:hypothetical protein